MRTILLAAIVVSGCAQEIVVDRRDAGLRDAGRRDAGPRPRDGGGTPRDAGFTNGADASTTDASSRDAGPRDGGATFTCFIDPFSPCDDPDEAMRTNNEWSSASAFHTTSVGCQTGDDFLPLDRTVSSRICHIEPADFYRLTLVPCDTRTMLAEIRLRLLDVCPDDRYELVFFRGGGRLDCDDPNDELTCTTEGGDRVIRLRVPPGNSILSWQFGVESDFEDVRFDYELTVRLQ